MKYLLILVFVVAVTIADQHEKRKNRRTAAALVDYALFFPKLPEGADDQALIRESGVQLSSDTRMPGSLEIEVEPSRLCLIVWGAFRDNGFVYMDKVSQPLSTLQIKTACRGEEKVRFYLRRGKQPT
ncbi:hypothetical protein HNP46_000429 [Pseudomonas nitritireducens]|uniref:Uncharacterized protein n=1 Tax=Pseudomonas nitroreducens TaxID=46680 RepID=A0A7W7KGD9_PSENT|nr:hypothetical protein [Pseudomonas nitritireducens]MBB4861618.1 hypothetical protein [Pseudomonas nitritireducens]